MFAAANDTRNTTGGGTHNIPPAGIACLVVFLALISLGPVACIYVTRWRTSRRLHPSPEERSAAWKRLKRVTEHDIPCLDAGSGEIQNLDCPICLTPLCSTRPVPTGQSAQESRTCPAPNVEATQDGAPVQSEQIPAAIQRPSRLEGLPSSRGPAVSLDSCHHAFHLSCLTTWFLLGRRDCPVCRREYITTVVFSKTAKAAFIRATNRVGPPLGHTTSGAHPDAGWHPPNRRLYEPDLPERIKSHGLVYVLGPYGRGPAMAALNAQCFAVRGYLVLFASSRGTGGSEGTFVPAMSEHADSQVVVKWMRDQPWYPGKFVTFGPSYLGYAQWALLRDPPDDLIASIILCSVFDHSSLVWTKGVYRMDRISWSYLVANQDQASNQVRQMVSASPSKLRSVMEATPILGAVERLFDGKAPYIRKFMTTPNIDDPFWAPCKHGVAIDLVNVPLLLRSGWHDTFTAKTMEAYRRLRDRGKTVYITISPWTNTEACEREALPEVFEFLDEYVVGRTKDHRPLPVKVFVTGAEEWRSLPSWPPATEERVFYLHGDKTVGTQRPAADSPSASFTFNPTDPTPTMGGPLLARGGRVNDSAYASRSDIIVYTSAPLIEEVEIMGRPIVELAHSTNIPYADLWVRLIEVNADGVSHNINENWQALDDMERQDGKVLLTLTDRAHVFKKNQCIRVIVAGGSFPIIARNPGTGVNRTQVAELRPMTHTVQHGNGISKLVLPCSC